MNNKELKKEKKVLEIITEFYLIALVLIFPLLVNNTGYFHIFECKWYSYVIIAGIYIGLCTLTILYYKIFEKVNIFKYHKLNKIHYFAILFLFLCNLSTFLSPFYKNYNLWIGTGRGEGLLMMNLYIITFLFVSLFSKNSKKHFLYFSISSILLNGIAVLQFIGFNPFHLYQNGIGTHNVSFMTTIGNIDFISALYCLLLPISFSSFVFFPNSKKEELIHGLSILLGSLIIGVINVQSGKLAMIMMIIIVFPFMIQNNHRFSSFIKGIALILGGYALNVLLNPVYHYSNGMLQLEFQFNSILILYILVIGMLLFISKKIKETNYQIPREKYIKKYYIGLIALSILGIIGIYIIPFKSGFLYEIHEILHGNLEDSFGTYRLFLWKRTIPLLKDAPLLGTGPDTFAIRFMREYTEDVMKIGAYSINDTAANVYLTMMINLGILGLLSYLGFLFCQIKKGIKNGNKESFIFLIAILCYIIQDFFNLSIVMTTSVFFATLGMHVKALEQTEK